MNIGGAGPGGMMQMNMQVCLFIQTKTIRTCFSLLKMFYIFMIDGTATRSTKSTTNAFKYDGRTTRKSDAPTESNECAADVATATAAARGTRQCPSTWAKSTKPKSNDGMHSMILAEVAGKI